MQGKAEELGIPAVCRLTTTPHCGKYTARLYKVRADTVFNKTATMEGRYEQAQNR